MLARFKRLDGYDVMFLTGTDEHGQKVEKAAQDKGVSPQAFTDSVSQNFRDLTGRMNFSNDDFIRTTEPRHRAACQALWCRLLDRGHISLGSYAGWYAVRDEAFYTETEIVDGKSTEYDIETFNHGSATRKAAAIFAGLGLGPDMDRARNGRKIRAGKATMRGRVHKTPKSVLLVVKEKSGLAQAARNLPGVDVVAAKDLNAEDLAPGGDVGRLTVFTKSALEELN